MLESWGRECTIEEFCDEINNRKFYRWYPRRRCTTRRKKSVLRRARTAAQKIPMIIRYIPNA